jgi:tagatose 1,6-diphosphate aldolase
MHGVAVDQGSGLEAAISKARGGDARDSDLFDFKKAVVETLSPNASVLLVDAEYGRRLLPSYHPDCKKLVAYEADVYHITTSERITALPNNLAISDYREMGVNRLKFFLYYGPRCERQTNAKKHALVRDIGAQCAEQGIEFLFEPIVYDDVVSDSGCLEFAKLKPELVRDATRQFSDPEFNIDVLKVEIPVNLTYVEGFGTDDFSREWALSAFRRAAEPAGDIPLVYLSAGVSFDWFERSLELAREADIRAAGFMCGRAIWTDAIDEFGQGGHDRLTEWLKTEGRRRIERLKQAL